MHHSRNSRNVERHGNGGTMNDSLVTTITREGQPFVDDPIVIHQSPIAQAVAHAFDQTLPPPITVGYERVRLRWVNPDGTVKTIA